MSCHLKFTPEIGLIASKQKFIERKNTYDINPKLCQTCNHPIPYRDHKRKKYCNRSCAAIKNNSLYVKRDSPERVEFRNTIHTCLNCGVIINSKKVCSTKCQMDLIYKQTIELWLNGVFADSEKIPAAIRRYMLEESNYKCSKCNWGEINLTTGKSPLAIDHQDGNPKNHNKNNLRVLCPNCHSLTSNYGSLNKGNGRKKRYKAEPVVV